MKMRVIGFFAVILLLPVIVMGDDNMQNTVKYDSTKGSPEATIDQLSWLAGHWKGEAFGGTTEEIWSEPDGGAMMGSFRTVQDNKIGFYELQVVREINGTLELNLKHFNSDMTGWEEKAEVVTFKLVKFEEGKLYFDNFTFEKVSDNEINIYVVIGYKDGSKKETIFNYKRVITS